MLLHRKSINLNVYKKKNLMSLFHRPVLILTDTKEFAFGFPTRYRTEVCKFIIECKCISSSNSPIYEIYF